MVLPFFLFFLLIGMLARAKIAYWRGLVAALAIQAIGANLPEGMMEQPVISWLFTWLLPLLFALYGMLKEVGLNLIARMVFIILWVVAFLFGTWDSFSQLYKNPASTPQLPKTETTIHPATSSFSNTSSSDWDPFTSDEGNFRVLSPLPAATTVSYRDVNRQQLKITTTRIRDTPPNPSYVIVTTTYPQGFALPDLSTQATLAMQHLLQTYSFNKLNEVKAIEQKGFNALAFTAENDSTQEFMTGLIIPTPSTLYQVMAITGAGHPNEEDVARFLMSFQPLVNPISGQTLKLTPSSN